MAKKGTKVEKQVPIPQSGKHMAFLAENKIEDMEVEDSLFLEGISRANLQNTVNRYLKRKNISWKITAREEVAGARFWRKA